MYAIAFDLKVDDLKKRMANHITRHTMKYGRSWRVWVQLDIRQLVVKS